jgi:hypothetical protein
LLPVLSQQLAAGEAQVAAGEALCCWHAPQRPLQVVAVAVGAQAGAAGGPVQRSVWPR